ncbi:electron transport complex subunit RsxC [Algicola sagamiensis]|uniref:electron transport complex subunit RsxC n=1 Tax=Algicola sagamiensis TaxID=163869 RepID=UPI000369E1B8|nr:electron transport complex subunit RsxC [Algicola sagamiensis]
METLLERIQQGHFWDFPGGIHPPTRKELTSQHPIAEVPLPPVLYVPIKQHIGTIGQILVSKGEHVKKGQALTNGLNHLDVAVHAPTSGVVQEIKEHISAHPSALPELCICIQPDGLDEWREREPWADYLNYSKEQLLRRLQLNGVAGLGGAGFPTHIKSATNAEIEFLIINAVECEPYITADDLLMQEYPEAIIQGIEILQHMTGAKHVLIGIEDDKPLAVTAIKAAVGVERGFHVCELPTQYPSGGEKQLVQILTGREVPKGGIPADIGIVMQNVGTAYAVSRAIVADQPLIHRVVTMTGESIHQPKNVWALLGTPVSHLLDHVDFRPGLNQRLIMGGPMMGFTLPSPDVPITKISNCILAPSNQELPPESPEMPCIRCGECAIVCPATLLPQQLQWYAKAKDYEKLESYNLADCIECGACSYVCPSDIPLVQYYRVAKAEIKTQQQEKQKAEQAKLRFEARKARLERDKQERLEKQRKASEARQSTSEDSNKIEAAISRVKESATDKVAAAIARAKAKRQPTEDESPDNSEVIAAREARKQQARDYKESKQTGTEPESSPTDKKAAVAAAIARAKAKKAKLAEQSEATEQSKDNSSENASEQDDRKAKIAAAIARAKAKKAQQEDAESLGEENVEPKSNATDDKKAKVAAAIERAKTKKAAKEAEANAQGEAETQASDLSPEEERKAKIAAAVARAKAKKAQKDNDQGKN